MLLLFDTNIILDILEKRQPFYEASKSVLEECISNDIQGCIALHSVSNIYYILRKRCSAADRRKLLLDLLDLLQVAGTDHEHVKNALQKESFSDFEDCLQDECAKQILELRSDKHICNDVTVNTYLRGLRAKWTI